MKKNYSFLILFTLIFYVAAHAQLIKGTYAIKNVATGMLLRIKDANKKDGTPLVSYSPLNWKCMTWDFQQVEGHTYQLKNLFTGKTFQPETTAANGTSLAQKPLVEKEATQLYEFLPAGKNAYIIRLKNTELYLTPADEKGAANSDIILAKKRNDQLQQWTIYEQHPEF